VPKLPLEAPLVVTAHSTATQKASAGQFQFRRAWQIIMSFNPRPGAIRREASEKAAAAINDFRLVFDHTVADAGRRLPKYHKTVADNAPKFADIIIGMHNKRDLVKFSGRFTGAGAAEELRAMYSATRAELRKLKDATVVKLRAMVETDRAAAIAKQQRQHNDPVDALRHEMRLRELRDHLRTLDPLAMQVRLKQAVRDGASFDLLEALEGAPAGFELAPAETVAQVRAAIAERTNPNLSELAQLADVMESMHDMSAQEVLKAAREDAIDIWEPAPSQG
jgi:hypothetical protein